MANNNHVIISSVIYKFSERVIVKLIAFVISIVLARMLEPETFGLLAIITVFTNFCQVFVQGGINVALIQSKEVNRKDYSTAFWISLVVAGITYAVLFFLAPYISRYYHTNNLIAPLRVLSICLVFCAYNSIQTAKMTRNMAFKKMFICSLITTIIAGTVGIIAAYKGFGLWALILYHLFTQIMVCITMFVAERWLPQFEFSIKRAKELFSYGWKILVSNLLYSVYTDIRALLIGRFYTTEDTGILLIEEINFLVLSLLI